MCSISGAFSLSGEKIAKKDLKKLYNIIRLAEDRGRDSFGLVYINDDKIEKYKKVGRVSDYYDSIPYYNAKIIINNNRAEPTTEFVRDKKEKDIQPFISNDGRIVLAHNGTIANDIDLKKKVNLDVASDIDSAVLTEYLAKKWDGGFESLREILANEVIGSYALAIVDRNQPDVLYLAVNYKPLFLEKDGDVLYFTSLENYFNFGDVNDYLFDTKKIIRVKPYTLLKIDKQGIHEISLWQKKEGKKVLVVCSGGMDSTVTATHYVRRGYDVDLLHFKYKCRAEKKEVEAVKNIAKDLGCGTIFVDTEIFKKVIKNSRLTETKLDIVKERDGEAGAELALEWVPARNLIMLSIAVGMAEAYGYDIIALGNNLEESGAYPDNEMEFINRLNDVLPFATNLQKRVRIEMPVGNLMKHEIVKKGLEEGAPLDKTWSCYEAGDKHCGVCGPCYMRKNAFKMNGIEDMIEYEV